MPKFETAVQETLERMLVTSLKQSKIAQGTELNFESRWNEFYAKKSDNPNWFYAMGGYYYWIGANAKIVSYVTGGNAIVKVVYKVAVSDYYNWDAGKATLFEKPEGITLPPLPPTYEGKIIDLGNQLIIYDTALAELHKAGIAQEFHIAGETRKMIVYYEYSPVTSELTTMSAER
jgi:hypothetical protein